MVPLYSDYSVSLSGRSQANGLFYFYFFIDQATVDLHQLPQEARTTVGICLAPRRGGKGSNSHMHCYDWTFLSLKEKKKGIIENYGFRLEIVLPVCSQFEGEIRFNELGTSPSQSCYFSDIHGRVNHSMVRKGFERGKLSKELSNPDWLIEWRFKSYV